MSGPAMLFWLVANVICAVLFMYRLRPSANEDRGWSGFWLAVSIIGSTALANKLVELLSK